MTSSSPDVTDDAFASWLPPDLRTVAAPASADATPAGPTPEEAAYARGWAEGQAAFGEASSAEIEGALSAYRAAVRALEAAAGTLRGELATTVHTLSIAIARHLLDREFEADPTLMQRLVAKALTLAPLSGPVTVRLHPDDLAALQAIGGVTESTNSAVDLRWTGDPSLVRGGCVVEAPASIVDGRIDRALLDLYERLGHE